MSQHDQQFAKRPSVDIIIVNWNAGDQLRTCLSSIPSGDASYVIVRVVIVDNASSDASLNGLDSLGLPLTIIRNTSNRGFGAACNQGVADSTADYLLFLNPDTRLDATSLSRPISYMEDVRNSEVGVCGIRLIDDLGTACRTCTRLPTPRHFFSQMVGLDKLLPRRFPSHFMNEWDHTNSQDVDHVIGAFYLIRTPLFQQLNGFDERFFVYLEDLDLSWRVRKAGHRIHFLAEAQAYHKGGGTSDQVKAARLFYSLRSRNLFGYKHFHWMTATLLMTGTLLIEPFARIAHAAAKRSPAGIQETLSGYASLWAAWPPWKTANR
jgi:GT2 family glycosyltransferase